MPAKGLKTKERILTGASQIFNRKGIASTSVNDLLQATQTTRGNLYFHFSGKQELALAVLEREQRLFMEFLDRALAEGTPGEALKRFLRWACLRHQRSRFVGGCLFGNTALEASDTNPAFSALVSQVFNDWTAKIEERVRQAQQTHEIRNDLPAANLATLIVATLEGGIMQARLTKSEAPLKNCLGTLQTLLQLPPNPSSGDK